jgi:hypothetical protein
MFLLSRQRQPSGRRTKSWAPIDAVVVPASTSRRSITSCIGILKDLHVARGDRPGAATRSEEAGVIGHIDPPAEALLFPDPDLQRCDHLVQVLPVIDVAE